MPRGSKRKSKGRGMRFVVKGQIRQADGSPFANAWVRVSDRDLRSHQELGKKKTNVRGSFEIIYTSKDFVRTEKRSADLVFHIENQDGLPFDTFKLFRLENEKMVPVEAPQIIFNAGAKESVEIVIGGGELREPSEYERHLADLTPILQGLPIAQLTEDEKHQDITFLAGETGIDSQHIVFLVLAHRLAKETRLPPEAFYAFFRQNLPTRLPALLAQHPQVLRRALETSIRDNIIPARLRNDVDKILARLRELIVEHAFKEPQANGRYALSALLSTAISSPELQKKFLTQYVRHEGAIEDFWKAVRTNPDFKASGVVEKLQYSLQLGALTANHLPLVKELQQDGTIKSLRDLAKLDADAWLERINKKVGGKAIGFPPDVPGKDDEEKARNYAKAMARIIEEAFPTEVIAHRIEKDGLPGKDNQALTKDLINFFSNNPDLKLSDNVDIYLAKNRKAKLSGVKDETGVVEELKGIQRVFKLTPRYEEMKVLLADDLRSAQSITRMGQTAFTRKYSAKFGQAGAKRLYAKAHHTAAMALTLFGKYAAVFYSTGVTPQPIHPAIPNWTTLFGSPVLCECEHCRSVYSPAAYLVDILEFLKNNPPAQAKLLKDRRPDIAHIELSCENTNTPVPYVDLVNEVLENAVSPPPPNTPWPQTSWTPEELSANPEYINEKAYDELRQQVYPFDLPLDLWVEEARAYLEHLGVKRHELMEIFHKKAPPAQLTDIDIASEYLGLTPTEWKIIGGTALQEPWKFWGLAEKDNPIPHPIDSNKTIKVGWIEALARVSVFLQRSGLSYQELDELLKTKFINPDNNLNIESTDPNEKDTCDPAKLKITNLTKDTLTKTHRFIRVWRKLGWTMRELDKAITKLKPQDLNDTFLLQLSHIQCLRTELKAPLINMLSWWASIDTRSYDDGSKSLYEQFFLNKAVIKLKPEEEPGPFALKPDSTELKIIGQISAHIPPLIAALSLGETDLALLTKKGVVQEALNLTDSEIKNDTLNLANLSHLYRIVSLAKAVKLSIRDFLLVKALTGINPFDAAHTEDSLRFVEKVRKMRASGFNITELNYLLRHHFVAPASIAPKEKEIALILDEIRGGLQKIAAENTFSSDPTGELTRSKLAIVLPADQVDAAVALIDGNSTKTDGQKNAFIEDRFAKFLDAADAKAKLVGPPPALTEKEKRFAYVLKPLLNYLRRTLSESLVKQKLSEDLKLEAAAIEMLLIKLVKSPNDPTKMSIFLAPAFAGSDPNVKLTAGAFPDQFKTFVLLNKIAMLVSKFRVTPEQLGWLVDYGPKVGWLDLNLLPLTLTPGNPALFAGWERLADLFQLRDQLPLGEAALSEIFALARDAQTTEAALLQKLSERTGWKEEDLKFLIGAQGFSFTFPDAYKDERALRRLRACFVMMKRLGVSAEQCRNWTKADLTAGDARSVKQAVKAKYDNDQWLAVAKPLRDILREKQRSALVSYLVAHAHLDAKNKPAWQDSNGLYEYFLIDVEMSPCAMTSRIKQAISSVQLFVQRCLMNLEAGASIPLEQAEQWKWMKNYRVWEANRKVFLYPENWIEPELRDDKSPFFKELENQLLQNEVTMDTAEDAFLSYLEKLDDVARLEIVGMYHQVEYRGPVVRRGEKPVVDVLHVFGRTRGTPPIYYYRRRVNSSYWTAWEKVDVDFGDSDHLIPVVWNRRLHIFWPVFTEKAKDEPLPKKEQEGKKPSKYWEIQIAWSEYKNGKWSAKKVSPMLADLRPDTDLTLLFPFQVVQDKTKFFFKAVRTQPHLRIRTYRPHDISQNPISVWDFAFTGCDGTVLAGDPTVLPGEVGYTYLEVLPPTGTHQKSMMFVEDASSNAQLVLFEGDFSTFESYSSLLAKKKDIPTLNQTPGTFRLLTAHQDPQFASQRPFFYQDDSRTFFVIPENVEVSPNVFSTLDKIGLEQIYQAPKFYFDPSGPVENLGPVTDPVDPPLFEQSFAVEAIGAGAGALTKNSMMMNMGIAGGANVGPRGGAPINDVISDKDSMLPMYQTEKHYLFETFYHPHVCELIKHLNRDGIDGLLQRRNQLELFDKKFFADDYKPVKVPDEVVEQPYPIDDVDFLHGGAYSLYNWELFFHAPFLIADRLSKNQRFEEAQKWFHYIFDPTDCSEYDVPARFWKVRPFFENSNAKKTIQDLMKLLNKCDEAMVKQVDEWRKNPFKPHLIARLRITAYQKTVVMKYIDNLIAWGDQLFRRDTIESINEATQLYILAAQILGKRPEKVPPLKTTGVKTYDQLKSVLDAFANALVGIEDLIAACKEDIAPPVNSPPQLPQFSTLYFCIPKNDKLLGYWDTVADRLFKIRHCMNIEGVVRQLALFEPPIDPALLVKAFAAGVDIGSILNDMNAPLPHYRFNLMAQKAMELCNDVKALGAALLSALEKRDAEELALLRSSHELKLLDAVRQVKEKQIDEATEAKEGLDKAKLVTEARRDYYRDIKKISDYEQAHMDSLAVAHTYKQIAQGIHAGVAAAHLIPDFDLGTSGWAGSPVAKVRTGGTNFGNALRAAVGVLEIIAAQHTEDATMASIKGGYDRRWDDWKLQERLADKELDQIDKQIVAAEIRLAIAEKDLENHDKQIENAKEVDEYMRSKFTNRELYDWMVSQISAIYFQSYQLTYDIAKRSERAYRFELGLEDSNFIQFGYWDSLKKGLLSGEKLHYDLKRMEIAYLDQNKREYEITKHISLAMLDPIALVKLKETGECFVNLPEPIFDLDYPSHYMRRIKNASLTIPCVTGPYTSVNCTLTLLKNSVRKNTAPGTQYARNTDGNGLFIDDDRFMDSLGAIQSIVTSSGQNDSGLFEPNLRDERYLPFEGAGAISEWRLELPKEFKQFDYDTISDVILHLRYTAREGGGILKDKAIAAVENILKEATLKLAENRAGLYRLFSVKHEFPNAFHKLLNPSGAVQTTEFDLSKQHFPYFLADEELQISEVTVYLKPKEKEPVNVPLQFSVNGTGKPDQWTPAYANFKEGKVSLSGSPIKKWTIDAGTPGLDKEKLDDILILIKYTIS